MFDELLEAVRMMSPLETTGERSNLPLYRVSVNVYCGGLPVSTIGLNDLPYVMGLHTIADRESVLSWDGCPSGPVLDSVNAIYEREIASAAEMVRALSVCSVEISCVEVDAMASAIRTARNVMGMGNLMLRWQAGESTAWNDQTRKNTALILHLMTFGSCISLTVRKDFKPRPSSYLLLNPNTNSPVIRLADRQIVMPVLGSDESNNDCTARVLVPRPF